MLFFALPPPPPPLTARKKEILKNEKKAWRYHNLFSLHQFRVEKGKRQLDNQGK